MSQCAWWDSWWFGVLVAVPVCLWLWHWLDPDGRHGDRNNIIGIAILVIVAAIMWLS